jgi:hypothetical protein
MDKLEEIRRMTSYLCSMYEDLDWEATFNKIKDMSIEEFKR